jgi:hypothetical protein
VPLGPGGTDPIASLALDFLVPVNIESLGIKGVGVKMFDLAGQHFKTHYQAVVAEWYRLSFYASGKRPDMSANLVAYLAARRKGDPKEVAATYTWTYRRIQALYGPTQKLKAQVTENILDINNVQPGEHVIALFKPEP